MTSITISTLNDLHEQTYDALVDEYDEFAVRNANVVDDAIDKLGKYVSPSASVLDVGCAVGNISEALVKRGYRVMGIDISGKMIESARKRVPEANFIVGDFCTYEFPQTYDAIVAFAFLHLFPKEELAKILEIFKQTLKPGGYIYTGTTDSAEYSEGFETKSDFNNKVERFRVRWPRKQLDDFLVDNGFIIVKVYEHQDVKGKLWLDYMIKVKEK